MSLRGSQVSQVRGSAAGGQARKRCRTSRDLAKRDSRAVRSEVTARRRWSFAGACLQSNIPGQEPRKCLMRGRWLKFRCDFETNAWERVEEAPNTPGFEYKYYRAAHHVANFNCGIESPASGL